MLNRRAVIGACAAALATRRALAQPSRAPAKVGWLGWAGDTAPPSSLPLDALRSGLADLGWNEGRNLTLLQRVGERGQAAMLAAELVRAQVDVIVAVGPMIFFARDQAGTVPLVFTINGDPVDAGLVASLARPGGTLTGITALSTELAAKRLELLKTAQPAIRRVAVLSNELHPGRSVEQAASRAAATRLGLELQDFAVRAAPDFDGAFAAIVRAKVSALLAFPDTLINAQAGVIAEFTARQRLPAISGWSEFALAGNLMSYGPNHREFYRHAARYVDKLLRGAKAADLPIEQPTTFELVVNQQAARNIGLALPKALLLRADEVIG